MAELIAFDCNSEKIIVDYRLFTEALNYNGKHRDSYLRFLRDTLPKFMLKQREVKPEFCFLIASHQLKKLEAIKGQDLKLDETIAKYLSSHSRILREFDSNTLLTAEQFEKAELTLKEEQAYYVKLMGIIEGGFQDVVFSQMLLTGPRHAKQCADGVIDAGLKRVGSFDAETTYIEYKIIDPVEGDEVYIEGHKVVLGENMSTGGEAKLFYLNGDPGKNIIAKIYSTTITQDLPNCVKFQYLMRQREKKLDILFNDTRYSQILDNHDEDAIVFPIGPIYDVNENLVGVTMQNVKGEEEKVYQLHSIIKNKQYPYVGFDRLDLIEIAVQITKIVRKLHNCNIIIGDINLRNFLVTGYTKETLKVYAIDLDGCQIPEFPSYYETVGYRDPLWNIEDKLPRTKENEIYALLILIFEISHYVHPFQYNYSKGNGTIINDFQLNMQNRDFPYVNGKKEKDKNAGIKSPPTNANYVFSHLPSIFKDLFIKTFGEFNGEQNYRPSIDEVMSTLKDYKHHIEMDLDGSNRLEFDTFAISPKNRVTFKCSHVDCDKNHTYVHVGQLLSMLQRQLENPKRKQNRLFCGKHVQWYNNIKSFERKYGNDRDSLWKFRETWQQKIVENDLYELAATFFEQNPDHSRVNEWLVIKTRFEAQKKSVKKPYTKPKTSTTQTVAPTPVQRAAPPEAPKQLEVNKGTLLKNFLSGILKN